MTIAHPIPHAWLTTGRAAAGGGTGAPNYDEFADEAEITAIIAANPRSALAVEMPHRAPDQRGRTFAEALPVAVERLADAKASGAYRPATEVVVLYRITTPDGGDPASYGLFCLIDTDQIVGGPGESGLVVRNEDVFEEKVRERVALARATGHLLSPVLLLAGARGPELHAALAAACAAAGEPAATDLDQAGRTHAVWPLPAADPVGRELCALAGGGELVVADGNHRSLAAQSGGLGRFLAVVTTPASVTIAPYHRLLAGLPYPPDELAGRLAGTGLPVRSRPGAPDRPPPPGTLRLYLAGTTLEVTLRTDPAAPLVDNLDHAVVERLLRDVAGLDPDDKRVGYVGGDYPVSWLVGEVDAGRAAAAVLIAPVRVDDFLSVNLARQKMPRKSTWFIPKARAGLVLAEL